MLVAGWYVNQYQNRQQYDLIKWSVENKITETVEAAHEKKSAIYLYGNIVT